ncbi:MAG: hypothetical protein ICV87_06105 [Gemmatimonadetes bacterium]|nr:hypothetical protein [Gemmatimonadota bacterium]
MTISRDLARGMGGDVTVESTPGGGFHLPDPACARARVAHLLSRWKIAAFVG